MIELQAPEWWQQVPVLSGPTVELREVDMSDVDALFELLTDPEVSKYISPPPPSPAAFGGFVQWAHRQRAAGSCVCFAVVPRGLEQAIGLFQVRALDPSFKIAEWGFAMGASFWSTGIFQEAAVLVAEFAFRDMGVHRLEARAVVQNGRGNRGLEKLGARGEATLRRSFGGEHTQFLWAILAEEWPPQLKIPTRFEEAKLKRQIAGAIAARRAAIRKPSTFESSTQPFPFFLTDAPDPPEGE